VYWQRFRPGKTPDDVDRVLRFVLRAASAHIPAYRRLIEHAGVSLRDFRGVADLPAAPIIARREILHDVPIRDLLHVHGDPARLIRVSTSGYSGTPISIYMNRAEAAFRRWQVLASWRRLAPLPLALRIADFAGAVSDPTRPTSFRRGAIRIRRISHVMPIERQVRHLTEFAPHVISGPPTALDLLARGVLESPRLIRSVRLVACRGEVLFPEVRARLAAAFRCRVADFYSCEEIGTVASECPADPSFFHVNTDACVVEIVDGDGRPVAGQTEGRVLLTNLYNCTMPLIRYAIGDRASWAPGDGLRCGCGSRRPRIRLIGGREDDYLLLPGGRLVSPRMVGTAVYREGMEPTRDGAVRWRFRGFQVIQDAADHLTVRVIPEPGDERSLETGIPGALHGLHPDFRVTVMFVDDLPTEASGKFRKIVRQIVDSPDTEPR